MKKLNNPKKEAAIALKKAQTHIKKIVTMIEDDDYCIDIVEQILAIHGLLRSASSKILANHMRSCFLAGITARDDEEKEKLVKEIIDVLNMSHK